MLDVLRRGANSWLSKLVLGLIIASFVAFGITTRLTGGAGVDDALSVGSTRVSAIDLDQQYRRALDNFSAQAGHPLTREEAMRYGLPNQILTEIASRTTLSEEASQLGIAVSDNAVRQVIVDDPTLKGPSGQFDRDLLRRLLYQGRLSEDAYVADRRAGAIRQQIVDALNGGVRAPTAMLEVLNRYAQEERTVRYAVVNPPAAADIADPAADVLSAYFETRKATFRTPETRVLQLITLDPAKISKPDDITDDEAQAAYAATPDAYRTPEKRRIQQIPFDSKEAADAAAKRLADGLSVDALITELKLKPEDIDQGLLDKAGFVDPLIADAAFKLAKVGDVSGVVTGKLRSVIIRVTEIVPEVVKPFDDAKAGIKASLAAGKADGAVRALMKSIESARDERASFADVASRFKLDVVTTAGIDRTGKTADGQPLAGVDDPEKLAKAAFESDIGNQNDPLSLANGGYIFYDVVSVQPPRDRPLDEVRTQLVADWKSAEAKKQVSDKAKDLVGQLQAGEALDAVAQSAGLTIKTTQPFKRSDTPDGLTPAAVTAAFSGGEGTVASAPAPDEGRFILQVQDISEPAFFAEAESLKQPAEQFTDSLKTTLDNEFLRRVQADRGLRVNQEVIGQIIGLPNRPAN